MNARPTTKPRASSKQDHSILLDLTAATKHAAEVERLNRLYAALSQVNQAVVRARSEPEVYAKVCQAAFTYGGFRMVWFGKRHEATGIIHPVAHSCDAASDLDRFCFSIVHGHEPTGPIAAAIRDRKSAICNQLAEEFASDFWRQLAQDHGVGSAAVFPIQLDDKVHGVFVLLAGEAGFFRDRERLLLEEAATDVAFALSVLDQEQRRRGMEETLRQRQAKLDSLFRAVPAGIGVVAHQQIVEANQAFLDMTGYAADEVIGKPIWMIHATQEEYAAVEQEVRHGGPVRVETRWRRKDGGVMHVLVQCSWIVPQDISLGVTFVALDITQRIQAEVDLRASVQELEESRRIAHLGAYELDVSTGIWTTSTILDEIFGIEPASRLKQSVAGWLEIVHPEDRHYMCSYFETEVLGRLGAFDKQYRIIRPKDKAVRWVHGLGELVFAADGRIARMIGTIQDITKQKQVEEALARQEERLNSIFCALPSGVGVARNRILTEVNQRICEMSGYTMEELLGQNTRMLYESDADYEKAGHDLYRFDQRRISASVECRWRRKSGEPYDILICSSQLNPGDSTAITFTVTDITANKRMEEQLLRAQRMESIGTLASGVAHDLNNILAPIMLSIDLLRQKYSSPQDEAMLQMLAEGAQRGANIVKQLLLFGRGVEGKRAVVPLRPMLKEMIRVVQETFPRSILLAQKISPDLWAINADATQVHQVLLNLCVNARDAMPQGGRLLIHAENVWLDELYVQANPEARAGPYVVLKIADTGTGIPPEILSKIFDPFFTTKEQGKGTGLGLSTVMGILKGHQGFIQVASQRGAGTEFRVHFPALPQPHEYDVSQSSPALPPQGNGELILVVDDEDAIRAVTQRVLEQNGYRVLATKNGADGLVAYTRHPGIQAVVTDMVMPIMDGEALIRVLRSLAPQLPIIAVSGLAQESQPQQANPAEWDFLRKPFTSEELLRRLHQVLLPEGTSASATSGCLA